MQSQSKSKKMLFLLTLSALGVVYGDIGTSPLYAVNEIVQKLGVETLAASTLNILGPISLILWSLTLVVTIKYILIVLNADNQGEGGVFALLAKLKEYPGRAAIILGGVLILSAGLLFGDGIITPAISVLSAVEGLKVAVPSLSEYVIPITIVILTGLFLVQRHGTAKVGTVFGPIIGLWFLALAVLGIGRIMEAPQIFAAFNPYYAFHFIRTVGVHQTFIVMGSVMLAVTGGEALYADMGHFGKKPIRLSWFILAYPALMLNYLGQGAFLLSGHPILADNLFFSIIPQNSILQIFMLVLATCATIIASQALISGAFSIARAGINLNLIPRVSIRHTHEDHEGQIYIPFINWALYAGCIALVLSFKTSTDLASAYGLAVAFCMMVDTACMFLVSKYSWKWNNTRILVTFISLVILDATFLSANALKFFSGGYVPMTIGVVMYVIMTTWLWGRMKVSREYGKLPQTTLKDLIEAKSKATQFIDKAYVVMTARPVLRLDQKIPALMQVFLERYGVFPKNIVFLNVNQGNVPYNTLERFNVTNFQQDETNGSIVSVQVNFGFMEDHNVEAILEDLAQHDQICIDHDPDKWLVRIMSERICPAKKDLGLLHRIRFALFDFLNRNSRNADEFFGLGKNISLTADVVPVRIE